ncbi:MAG: cation:proton antiporter [Candidatus Aenigmarchaeota archaeon]|nr:cation:proton antiporter [Candidatus Aenigmarchaeota archaeon]
MADIALTVTYFAFLLGFGVLIANVLKKAKIPDTFFLLLLGLVMGPTVFLSPMITQYMSITLVDVSVMGDIPDFLRILALILVVFTGTFNLSMRVFQRVSDISVKLAFLGVFFNTVFFGIIASFMFQMNIIYALLLGAVVSGTGTGVLYAFETALSKYKKVITVIKVESIFNSPLTVLLPILFLDLVYLEPGALLEPLKYMTIFWQMIAAGVGTGLIIGFAVSKLLKSTLREYTPLLVFAIALITYAMAEAVGGSGMLAVAICGLIAGNMVFKDRDDKERQEVKQFDDQLSEMLRISVFTLLGAQVALPLGDPMLLMAFIFFLIVFFSRPLFLIPSLGKMRQSLSKRDMILMNFVSPRGLSAAAMAPLISTTMLSIPNLVNAESLATQMVNIIFIVVLLSVLFSTIVAWTMSLPRFNQPAKRKPKQPVDEKEMEMEQIEKAGSG